MASCIGCLVGWVLLSSTQLEGAVATRTSSSVKENSGFITHWSSTTLSAKWQGLLGIGSWIFSTQYWRSLM